MPLAAITAWQGLPHVEAVYPLAAVRAAQRRLEDRHVQGKVVLDLGAEQE